MAMWHLWRLWSLGDQQIGDEDGNEGFTVGYLRGDTH